MQLFSSSKKKVASFTAKFARFYGTLRLLFAFLLIGNLHKVTWKVMFRGVSHNNKNNAEPLEATLKGFYVDLKQSQRSGRKKVAFGK